MNEIKSAEPFGPADTRMAEAGSRLSSTFPQIDFERSDFDTALAVQPLDVPVLPESAAYLDADESKFQLKIKHGDD